VLPPILVIKLGALGDFVLATGPFAAIRAYHRNAEITLLTTAPFAELASRAIYFNRVWVDERPDAFDVLGLWRLRGRLRAPGFARIYDLQTSDRSSLYFHLMGPGRRPEWSGVARGASHRQADSRRETMHTLDRQADQLRLAGIESVPPPDMSWVATEMNSVTLPDNFLLLAPGGAAHRPRKRWPRANYVALAAIAAGRGLHPVIIGGAAEQDLAREIVRAVPDAIDLTARTTIGHLAWLGQRARYAVGNDTGPMHVLAAAGASVTVLFSSDSDPALTAPRGPNVTILRNPDLAELPVAMVAATLPLG
jgi:ADP-heptose:LPS heptosyltransferase